MFVTNLVQIWKEFTNDQGIKGRNYFIDKVTIASEMSAPVIMINYNIW